MSLATLLGLAAGVVVDHSSLPLYAGCFRLGGTASLLILILASLAGHRDLPRSAPASLAGLAAMLMSSSGPPDGVAWALLSLPFTIGAGQFARRRAWSAAAGASGFSAVVVALAYCNRAGPRVGFFALYCV